MNTVSDIFDVCGGTTALASMLNVKVSTAGEMKRRQSIPVVYWPRLVREAAAKGVVIDNDTLVKLHTDELEDENESSTDTNLEAQGA